MREAFSFHSLFIGGDPFRVPAIYGALVYLQCSTAAGTPTAASTRSSRRWRARSTCAAARRSSAIEHARRARDAACGCAAASASPPTSSSPTPTCCARTSCSAAGRRARRLRETMSLLPALPRHGPAVPALLHHTLLVGDGYRDFIRDVTRGARAAARPSRPTCTRPRAPSRRWRAPGGDSLAVLLPVPTCAPGSTGSARPTACATRCVADLEATFGLTGLGDAIASSTA